ncbi:hypothetical protein PROFUN_16515, partial [Planoprotostelium fungivorum]
MFQLLYGRILRQAIEYNERCSYLCSWYPVLETTLKVRGGNSVTSGSDSESRPIGVLGFRNRLLPSGSASLSESMIAEIRANGKPSSEFELVTLHTPSITTPAVVGTEDEDSPHVEVPINVDESVKKFYQAEEELTRESIDHRRKDATADAEKGVPENFDLRGYFENSVRTATDAGGRPKKVGVSVRNLTVVGQGASESILMDLTTPFRFLLNVVNPFYWINKSNQKRPTFDILHDVSAYCKDGEMLLVLGRPGAGCSTLLRLIANARAGYVDVTGNVTYAGVPAEEFDRYSGEAIYIPEEDAHFPILT